MSSWIGLRDFWGRWYVDHAGEFGEELTLDQLEAQVKSGALPPRAWLRHRWTGHFALAAEVLFQHGRVSEAQLDEWLPKPTLVKAA